jgi:serine/threonine protein phosphatase 1
VAGRILAVGDVHGCDHALATLLETLEPTAADTFVFLGDIIDRGPSSKQVIDRILRLREQCTVILIMGNHEELLRESISRQAIRDQWLKVGGQATLDSYGGSIDDIPSSHLRFLVSASPLWETDDNVFIHASLETDVSLANQTNLFLRWKHIGGTEPPHPSGKRVICGHTSQRDGKPLVFDGWACIDTYAHGSGWLTCLDVAADHVYQTTQSGKVRDFALEQCT